MNVQNIEPTPNPNALKFNVDHAITKNGSKQFDSPESSQSDPLAKKLFSISGVTSVFYSGQFVSINKSNESNWATIEPLVIKTLESFNPQDLVHPVSPSEKKTNTAEDDLLGKINKVIDENVRPPLEADGGGIDVLELNGFVLTIHYQGSCGGCPSAQQGTMVAIQNLLQAMVDPRIQVVSA